MSSTEPYTRIVFAPRFTACRRLNFAERSAWLFASAAAQKPVYIFAGDVGVLGGNLTQFYQQDAASDAILLATGLGDSSVDSLLQVDVNAADVDIKIVPLGEKEFFSLAEYNLAYWEQVRR
jgi:hypothetical protein